MYNLSVNRNQMPFYLCGDEPNVYQYIDICKNFAIVVGTYACVRPSNSLLQSKLTKAAGSFCLTLFKLIRKRKLHVTLNFVQT